MPTFRWEFDQTADVVFPQGASSAVEQLKAGHDILSNGPPDSEGYVTHLFATHVYRHTSSI